VSLERLRPLGLIQGDDPLPARLEQACFDERLVGGLSMSLRATPDELVGPLAFAMGDTATSLKVLDVRAGETMVLEVRWRGQVERWAVPDVETLVERLTDLFIDEDSVRHLVVLGEWESMLCVWALRIEVLEVLLSTQLLDGARNLMALRDRFG
jgi:hypothetical protein